MNITTLWVYKSFLRYICIPFEDHSSLYVHLCMYHFTSSVLVGIQPSGDKTFFIEVINRSRSVC